MLCKLGAVDYFTGCKYVPLQFLEFDVSEIDGHVAVAVELDTDGAFGNGTGRGVGHDFFTLEPSGVGFAFGFEAEVIPIFGFEEIFDILGFHGITFARDVGRCRHVPFQGAGDTDLDLIFIADVDSRVDRAFSKAKFTFDHKIGVFFFRP